MGIECALALLMRIFPYTLVTSTPFRPLTVLRCLSSPHMSYRARSSSPWLRCVDYDVCCPPARFVESRVCVCDGYECVCSEVVYDRYSHSYTSDAYKTSSIWSSCSPGKPLHVPPLACRLIRIFVLPASKCSCDACKKKDAGCACNACKKAAEEAKKKKEAEDMAKCACAGCKKATEEAKKKKEAEDMAKCACAGCKKATEEAKKKKEAEDKAKCACDACKKATEEAKKKKEGECPCDACKEAAKKKCCCK
jgi:hypothetical protein